MTSRAIEATRHLIRNAHSPAQVVRIAMQHEMTNHPRDRAVIADLAADRIAEMLSLVGEAS